MTIVIAPGPPADRSQPETSEAVCTLADALDRLLHRGVSLEGNLSIGVAEVDLLYLDLRLLLAAVDTVWPDGIPADRGPPADASPEPTAVIPPSPSPSPAFVAAAAGEAVGPPPSAPTKPSAAGGLARLVLTLVKLLHDLLERLAVRRMAAGRLSEGQIDRLGSALLAQALEIERLCRDFGFSEDDLALRFGAADRLN